jgi:TetR/AcrR family transcriptional regulator, repressor for uid operon
MAVVEAPSDATRDRLLDAAAAVFAEKGYDRAGVQEIARRAGLTTGAIYGRFTGKADLLQAAIEAHSTDELDDLFAQHRFEGHASDILRTVGSHLVMTDCPDANTAEGALLLEAFVAARRDPEVRIQLERLVEERAAVLSDLVEEAKLDGSIDSDLDTTSLVRFCHAVGLGFLLYDAISISLPQVEPWEQLINRLVGAIAPLQSTHKGD